MQRQRQNTEHELQIISVAHNTRLRVGRPSIQGHTQDFLYKLIYNKYYWNGFTYMLFLILRISSLHMGHTEVSINEWYNDTLIFLLANNYLFKRIHWNNKQEDYYSTNLKYAIVPFFTISLFIFSLWSHNTPTFYITKNSVVAFDSYSMMLFISVIAYTFLLQVLSIANICKSRERNKLLAITLVKYGIIAIYLCLDRILLALDTPLTISESVENLYHLHHWFCGLMLIFLNEVKQPYYTILQYFHYSIYLHGIALYSYDNILQ